MPKTAAFKVSMSLKGALPSVKTHMRTVLFMVAEEAKHEWIKLARRELHSTAYAYVDGIGDPIYRKNEIAIKLTGWLPNALENGIPPFDMKKGFLKSKKAKLTKKAGGGRYLTIPLQLKSYGSHGDSPPVMPSGIYKRASQLKLGQSLTLPKRYEGYGLKTRLSADIKRWGHYTWKTSPFQSIMKLPKWRGLLPTAAGQQSMYMVFRRVSKKSDPASWIHPGFRAKNLLEKTSTYIEKIFPKILDNVISAS